MSRLPEHYRESFARPVEPAQAGARRCDVCLDKIDSDLECVTCRVRRCTLHAGTGRRLFPAGACCVEHQPGSTFGPHTLVLNTASHSSSFKEKLAEAEAHLLVPRQLLPRQRIQAGDVVPARAKSLKMAAGDPWEVTAERWTRKSTPWVMISGSHSEGAGFRAVWGDDSFAGGWAFGPGRDFQRVNLDTLKNFVLELVAEPLHLF